ncbi:MAG: flagellar motor switch protein FliG, partial [Oscillospiraceae bacterium]
QISLEVSKLRRMAPEEIKVVMDDFYGLCVTQKVITEGGVDYAKDILEKAFGSQQANSYMSRVSNSLKSKAFDFLRKADYKNLLSIIQNEHPQTVALILSYSRSDKASQIISELDKDKKIEVVERIAKIDSASPEMIGIVEGVLSQKFSSIVSVDLMELGGVEYIADIMNNVDRSTEKQILDELSNKNPNLADEIKKLMFVFEDIVFIDDMSIQRFLREIDSKDLSVALKVSNEEVKDCIFRNMSSRVREQTQADIEYLHNVRMRDVEEAQQKIVSVIRKLEEEGEVVISKGGKDDIIA